MNAQSKYFEMGYTASEFKKTLQGQFIQNTSFSCEEINSKHWLITIPSAVSAEQGAVSAEQEAATVSIKIAQAPLRKIAMLSLPVLNTSFEFKNTSTTQASDFMKVFFRYFHKGGG